MKFPWSKKRRDPDPRAGGGAIKAGPKASDNAGSLVDTEGKGEAYFVSLFQTGPEPMAFYLFDSEPKARQALSDISCIATASDTGELICTEVLTYGVFPAVDPEGDPCWGAILAGKSLTLSLWEEARAAFAANGGQARKEEEPDSSAGASPAEGDPSLVKFSHERTDDSFGVATYVHHTAPTKADALAWLKQQSVDQRSYFLVVETPEGVISRDVQGIFES